MGSANSSSQTTRQYWVQRTSGRDGWWPWGMLPLIGLAALLLYGLFQTAPAIEADTAERVRDRLSADGLTDFTVEADGQEVLIRANSGTADADRVRYLASTVSCDTWIAGQRVCPNTVRVEMSESSQPAAPQRASALPRFHNFDLRKTGSSLVIAGEVPDENTRSAIVAAAQLGHATVTDDMTVTDDLTSEGFDWAVDRAWPLLAGIRDGQVTWRDGKLSASGSVDAMTASNIRNSFSATAFPDRLGELSLQSVSQSASCNDQFADALSKSSIEFKSGSAEISAGSAGLISELARIAAGCPIQLSVEGHTDNVGSTEVNEYLSLARAEAVTAALARQGIDASRLSAQGFGPERPIADNATAAGRARNRRIEIKAANVQPSSAQ